MARVFLTSVHPPSNAHRRFELQCLEMCAAADRFQAHHITHSPSAADLILFVERENGGGKKLENVLAHPLYHRYREKCFVVNPRFKGPPLLPGVYSSIDNRWYSADRHRSAHYPEVFEDPFLCPQGPVHSGGYLYSFRGNAQASQVRRNLARLPHPLGFFEDTAAISNKSTAAIHGCPQEGTKSHFIQEYVDVTRNSKFVLCPRGTGPSSLRLFESMLMGRAPVIISDAWVPPEGPNWDHFSVRVKESAIHTIPILLKSYEDRAPEMGRRARAAWLEWFSPEVTFHRIVEWCLSIQRTEPSLSTRWHRIRCLASTLHSVRVAEHLAARGADRWKTLKINIASLD